MTNEEQRMEIAEACGWTVFSIGTGLTRLEGFPPNKKRRDYIPDYPNDLNAMHEAEKTLNEKQQVWYLQKLTQVRYKAGVSGMLACMIDKTTFATAAQRAEAFLRCLGKWVE